MSVQARPTIKRVQPAAAVTTTLIPQSSPHSAITGCRASIRAHIAVATSRPQTSVAMMGSEATATLSMCWFKILARAVERVMLISPSGLGTS